VDAYVDVKKAHQVISLATGVDSITLNGSSSRRREAEQTTDIPWWYSWFFQTFFMELWASKESHH